MHKKYLAVAAVCGGLAVALGAFGAHGLEKITNDEKILQAYRTGVQYQVYHALALLVIAAIFDKLPVRMATLSANFFIAGIILFSGSLYLITFLNIQESTAVRLAGPITPVGGLCFIVGWVFLLIAATREK